MPAGSDASDVWVIVPTYDEAENVGTLVDAALTALSSLEAPLAGHLLIVDDDSPDGRGSSPTSSQAGTRGWRSSTVRARRGSPPPTPRG